MFKGKPVTIDGKTFESQAAAARAYGINPTNLRVYMCYHHCTAAEGIKALVKIKNDKSKQEYIICNTDTKRPRQYIRYASKEDIAKAIEAEIAVKAYRRKYLTEYDALRAYVEEHRNKLKQKAG